MLVGVFVAVFGGAAAVGLLGGRSDDTRPDDLARERRAIAAYQDAIRPAVNQAGRAIVAGIRADLAEFEAGRLSDELWRSDLASRRTELASARAAILAVEPPRGAARARAWFDEAFDLYLQAVDILESAAGAPPSTRAAALRAGAKLGETGDRLFDRGAAEIQAARRALGLAPAGDLPDKRF